MSGPWRFHSVADGEMELPHPELDDVHLHGSRHLESEGPQPMGDLHVLLHDGLDDAAREHPPSPFAIVARASGTSLMTTKLLLQAFSHAIEEECLSDLADAHVFGSFQHAKHYVPAQPAWARIAEKARSAHAFADFSQRPRSGAEAPVEVDLGPDSPLAREWSVVVDRPRASVALTALERPDQAGVPDADRLFDSAWTTAPHAVRRTARIWAAVATSAGSTGAEAVVEELAAPPSTVTPDVALGGRLLDRLLTLIDTKPA